MEVPKSLRKAMKKVREVFDDPSEAGRLARLLYPLLEAAADELSSTTLTRPSRRGTGDIGYVVEKTQQGDVLTENRHGGKSKPFRCPKAVYDALAVVLGEADRPLLLDEIMSALEKRMGDRPADHQVRASLRLWLHVVPALLSRSRARYRSTCGGQSLNLAAHNLWNKLKGEPSTGEHRLGKGLD